MTARSGRRARRDDEGGAVLVLTALLMVALLGTAAVVVDLQLRRVSVREQQGVADLAALAAGAELGGDPAVACARAVAYFNENVDDASPLDPAGFCHQPGNDVGATTCTGGALAAARPSATTGRYTLRVHYPVPASEIADPAVTGGARIGDGAPCERMRVVVDATNSSYFGRVYGEGDAVTTRSAVVKISANDPLLTPVLWLLDPTGCVALSAGGGTTVNVGTAENPGLIAVDSDGSGCSANQYTVSRDGANTRIRAVPTTGSDTGAIALHALPRGATQCVAPACNPADVGVVLEGSLAPQPIPAARRATRALVDWRFDCHDDYPDYFGIEITDCGADTPAYVSLLATAQAATTPSTPAGFQVWSQHQSCNPSGAVVVTGNWLVDCGGQGLTIGNGTSVTFAGGNVIVQRGIKMTGGSLAVNTANPVAALPPECLPPLVTTPCTTASSRGAAFLYMRNGGLELSGGTVRLDHVTFFQRNGALKFTGGGAPVWSAPTEGPFRALSLWNDTPPGNVTYSIQGGSGMALSGIFFTPNANPFSIAGGSPVDQQQAQFISYRLAISGGGSMNLAPNPDDFVQIPPVAGVLIR